MSRKDRKEYLEKLRFLSSTEIEPNLKGGALNAMIKRVFHLEDSIDLSDKPKRRFIFIGDLIFDAMELNKVYNEFCTLVLKWEFAPGYQPQRVYYNWRFNSIGFKLSYNEKTHFCFPKSREIAKRAPGRVGEQSRFF